MKSLCAVVAILLCSCTVDSWSQPTFDRVGPYGGYIRSLAKDVSGNIYAGTFLGGIFKTTDNGTSWVELYSDTLKADFRSVAVNSSGYIFGGTDGLALQRSTDGGATWQKMGAGFFTSGTVVEALLILPGGDLLVGALSGNNGVYRSTNNGTTFSFISTGLTNRNIYSLAVNTNGDLFAGTSGGGVFRSTDNGANWSAINTGIGAIDMSVYGLAAKSATEVFAATGTKVYRSTDNGDNWTPLSPAPTASYSSIAFAPNGDVYAAATSISNAIGGGVFKSTDDGATWAQESGLQNIPHSALVTSGSTIYAGTEGPGVFQSNLNLGPQNSWSPIDSGMTNTHVFVLEKDAGGTMYAGTRFAGVYKSIDSGLVWVNASNGLPHDAINAIAVNPVNGYVFAANNSAKYRSIDSGAIWQQVVSGGATMMACNSQGILFAGFGSQLGKSTDNGTTWTYINLFPVVNMEQIVFDEHGAVDSAYYLATGDRNGITGQGVYRSTDKGTIWGPFNTGLTNLNVTAVSISYIAGQCPKLTVGTKGGGEFAFNETTNQWGSSGLAGTTIVSLKDFFTTDSANIGATHFGLATAFLFARDATCLDNVISLFGPIDEVTSVSALINEPPPLRVTNRQAGPTVFVGTNGRGILRGSDIITSASTQSNQIPMVAHLKQNYPNPFNPGTTLSYQLPERNHVTLKVFDILGREITTLVNDVEEPGYKSVKWDATGVASGVYFYRVQAGSYSETKKMVLMK